MMQRARRSASAITASPAASRLPLPATFRESVDAGHHDVRSQPAPVMAEGLDRAVGRNEQRQDVEALVARGARRGAHPARRPPDRRGDLGLRHGSPSTSTSPSGAERRAVPRAAGLGRAPTRSARARRPRRARRSPGIPLSPSHAPSRRSPAIDLTGYRHSSRSASSPAPEPSAIRRSALEIRLSLMLASRRRMSPLVSSNSQCSLPWLRHHVPSAVRHSYSNAHRDAVVGERPQLLAQPVVELALPLARQERPDRVAAPRNSSRLRHCESFVYA